MANPVQRFLAILSSGLRGEIVPTITGGVANGGNLVALDPVTGFLPFSMLPPDIDSAGEAWPATEALNGPLVNVYNSGTPAAPVTSVRNADATTGKPATGFIAAPVSSGAVPEIYYAGKIPGLTFPSGTVPGTPLFLGSAGAITTTPTTTPGQILQNVGTSTGLTSAAFSRGAPELRA